MDGNNLHYVNNAAAGIRDTDDASSGSNAVPDYYKSPISGGGWMAGRPVITR